VKKGYPSGSYDTDSRDPGFYFLVQSEQRQNHSKPKSAAAQSTEPKAKEILLGKGYETRFVSRLCYSAFFRFRWT
jgi:hypothetical protein